MPSQEPLLLILCLSLVTTTVHSLSTGAPSAACTRIYPEGHAGPTQDLASIPYQLNTSMFTIFDGRVENVYQGGQVYTISVSGQGGEEFRGVLVQARTIADDSPVGTFTTPGSSDFRLSSCSPPETAVTHANSQLKTSASFEWTAPPEGTGDIEFLYAVVLRNSGGVSEFWATARSEMLSEELKVRFVGGTPDVDGDNNIRVSVEANRPGVSIMCVAELLVTATSGLIVSTSDCSNGSATFDAGTGGDFRVRVIATANGVRSVVRRRVNVANGQPTACAVHLVNEVVVVNDTVSFEFQGVGVITLYECNVDKGPEIFACASPLVLPNLLSGDHVVKVIPRGPLCTGKGSRRPLRVRFTTP